MVKVGGANGTKVRIDLESLTVDDGLGDTGTIVSVKSDHTNLAGEVAGVVSLTVGNGVGDIGAIVYAADVVGQLEGGSTSSANVGVGSVSDAVKDADE